MDALRRNPQTGTAINAIDSYKPSLSKVVHAWNSMQQSLGLLFCEISGLNGNMGLAIWYALKNRRDQYDVLNAALTEACTDWDFRSRFPKAFEDINWLLDSINFALEGDNDAIRANIFSLVDQNNEITALQNYEKLDARNSDDDKIVAELEAYENVLKKIGEFVNAMSIALSYRRHHEFGLHQPWPSRPILPQTSAADTETTREVINRSDAPRTAGRYESNQASAGIVRPLASSPNSNGQKRRARKAVGGIFFPCQSACRMRRLLILFKILIKKSN